MGPLTGFRIIELASIGPGPFCGMMLADMGAEVIRIDRPGHHGNVALDPMCRNRKSIICDLKQPAGVEVVLKLVERADGLIEGFRPGVTERMGLGPTECLERNPRLVYTRVTGWGQDGPLSRAAGHDINYVALTGALKAIGRAKEKPVPPLNLVGDFGAGGMFSAFGTVCAVLHARQTGEGQVVDAAMLDGTHTLMAQAHWLKAMGMQDDDTGSGFLSGAAHFYDTYETSDGRYICIAAIEPQFYELLIEALGLDRERFAPHVFAFGEASLEIRSQWKTLSTELEAVFKTRTQADWCELLEGSDVCFAPVLGLSEAPDHPHNMARKCFVEVDGQLQPAPAPRFSHSSTDMPKAGVDPGTHSREVLALAGYTSLNSDELIQLGAVEVKKK